MLVQVTTRKCSWDCQQSKSIIIMELRLSKRQGLHNIWCGLVVLQSGCTNFKCHLSVAFAGRNYSSGSNRNLVFFTSHSLFFLLNHYLNFHLCVCVYSHSYYRKNNSIWTFASKCDISNLCFSVIRAKFSSISVSSEKDYITLEKRDHWDHRTLFIQCITTMSSAGPSWIWPFTPYLQF